MERGGKDRTPGAATGAESSDGYVFPRQLRAVAVAYCVVGVVAAGLATLWVRGENPYIVAWILAAAALSVPGIAATAIVLRRSTPLQRNFWRLWLAGQLSNGMLGLTILFVIGFSVTSPEVLLPLFGLPSLFFVGALVILVRMTLGRRALSVDVLDVMVASGAVAAPGAVWLASQLPGTHEAWHAIAFSLVAALLPGAAIVLVRVFNRLSPGERASVALGIALTAVATLNAGLQVIQNLSGFTLPTTPLVMVQCSVYSLLLLISAFAPDHDPIEQEPAPVHAQVRRHGIALVLVLLSIPVLIVEAVTMSDVDGWTVPFALAVLGVLVGLAATREFLSSRETRRLYAEVERLAAERKVMLANLLRAFEQDRHRTAVQLHEQAVGALVMLGTLIQASLATLPPSFSEHLDDALTDLRAELAGEVESLRRFVLAISPRSLDGEPVGTAIAVRGAELFGDGPHVALKVTVDPELALDWTSATIVYRIAEEALSNVRRHSHATEVAVEVSNPDDVVQIVIRDNGVGFEPSSITRSGIATMHLFADLAGGHLDIRSTPGQGSVVRAVLGGGVGTEVDPPPSGRLHLIVGGESSGTTAAAPSTFDPGPARN